MTSRVEGDLGTVRPRLLHGSTYGRKSSFEEAGFPVFHRIAARSLPEASRPPLTRCEIPANQRMTSAMTTFCVCKRAISPELVRDLVQAGPVAYLGHEFGRADLGEIPVGDGGGGVAELGGDHRQRLPLVGKRGGERMA